MASQLFDVVSHNAKSDIDRHIRKALTLAHLGTERENVSSLLDEDIETELFPVLIEKLKLNDLLYSLYYGFEDGRFFQIIPIRDSNLIREKHKAPKKTHWIVRYIVKTG